MASVLNFKPVVRGNVKGLSDTSRAAAAAVHMKPILVFMLSGQVFVDENQNVVDPGTEGATLETVYIDYHLQIDPTKIKPEHNNRIAAMNSRIQAGQRMTEKMALAVQGDATRKVTKADLPDTDLMSGLYKEYDDAQDDRLLACVMKDEFGNTAWDYRGPGGETVNLTKELLTNDLRLAEAVNKAYNAWYTPTRPSSGVDTLTNKGDSTTDSTPPIREA